MTPHDDLLSKWHDKLAQGTQDSCLDPESLQPGSFCTVFQGCWGGPSCDRGKVLTPEYFESPADFVAFVRVVELQRSLDLAGGDEDAAASLPLAEAVIAAADAALAKPEVTVLDAEDVVAAYNAVFCCDGQAEFVAWGDLSAVFATASITDEFDAWSEDGSDLLDEDEPQMIVKGLLEAGEFDPNDPEHVAMARGLLSWFPQA